MSHISSKEKHKSVCMVLEALWWWCIASLYAITIIIGATSTKELNGTRSRRNNQKIPSKSHTATRITEWGTMIICFLYTKPFLSLPLSLSLCSIPIHHKNQCILLIHYTISSFQLVFLLHLYLFMCVILCNSRKIF